MDQQEDQGMKQQVKAGDADADPATVAETMEAGSTGGSRDEMEAESAAVNEGTGGEEALELHAVTPLPWCPHLVSVGSLPGPGLDTKAPCSVCDKVGENWICLTCYEVHCSRYVNEHMLKHSLETEHRMVLSYADLSVWCYACDVYVHNEVLLPAKKAAHLDKFGVEYGGKS